MGKIREEHYKWIWIAVFLIAAVLSFTLIHDIYINGQFTKTAITYLDTKANTVLALTGASTSASVAITMIPGDIGTPIADQLANISSYSIIVLAAVHLEKYLITIAAVAAFRFLIPASLLGAAINIGFFNNETVNHLIKRVCAFSIALVLVIPASVYLSRLVETTYKEDVQLCIEQTQKDAEEIKENIEGTDQTLLEKFVNTISGGAVTLVEKFETSLNNFVEAISVMLITACVIPILTFMVLIWLVKSILQIDIKTPSLPEMKKRIRMDQKRLSE
ncbi:MAG: hypothetical protein IJ225_11405 [Solobacterium sp.]|nr:hypothetical protein [Solobacterium sp.]